MNSVGLGSVAKEYVGKTVKATKVAGGKHLEFKPNSPLLNERGITDMWCYTNPKTGDPMLYLEGEKGNLIREFNLKNQLDQVKNYFNKANTRRNNTRNLERQEKELSKMLEDAEDKISYRSINRDDGVYTYNGKEYWNYASALDAALEGKPELKEAVKQREDIRRELQLAPYHSVHYFG